jgi:hypothetical protein
VPEKFQMELIDVQSREEIMNFWMYSEILQILPS